MGKQPREDEDDGREDSGEERPRSLPPPLPDERIREGPSRRADEDQGEAAPRPRRPRREDEDDDRPRRRPRRDDDAMSSLIPYKNGMALAAYYCGVFSLIPCAGVVLAIVAIILGILGLNYARQHPEAKGGGHAIAGIVLGALSLLGHIVVIGLIVFAGLFR